MVDPIIDTIMSIGTNIVSAIIYDFAKDSPPAKKRFFSNSLLLSKDAINTLDKRVQTFLANRRWEHSIHPVAYAYFKLEDPSDVARLRPLVCAALFEERYSVDDCRASLEALQVTEFEKAKKAAEEKPNASAPDIDKFSIERLDVAEFVGRNIKDLRKTLFENDEISKFFVSRIKLSEEALSDQRILENSKDDAPDRLLLEYCEEIQARASRLMMSGIDAFLKQEQIESRLEASFVSLSLEGFWKKSPGAISENAERVFSNFRCIIARGDAGSGKTTLLQWISLQCAKSILGQPRSSESVVTWGLTVPIFIPLRHIVTNFSGKINISDFVVLSTDSLDFSRKVGPNWINSILDRQDALVMFDGLDELSFDDRSKFWGFIRTFVRKYPRAKVIITSRHLSYTHTADGNYKNIFSMTSREFASYRSEWNPPPGFVDFQIAPLTNEQIHLFIERWHQGLSQDVLHPDIIDQLAAYKSSLIETIESSKHADIKALCEIPLLCALVCIVNLFSHGRLPDSLKKLYSQSVRILSQTRDEVRNVPAAAEYRILGQPHRNDILGHIALTMQEGATRSKGQMTLEVNKSDVLAWIDNYRIRHGGFATKLSNEDILRFYTERTNILREPTLGKIDFIHRSFMEFMAANEFVRRREAFTLRPFLFDDSWTGVLKFLMDTEEGGSFFGGTIIDCLASQMTSGSVEKKLLRLSEIMTYSNRIPDSKCWLIYELLAKIWPPNTEELAVGLRNLPADSFLELLEYGRVAASSPERRAYVAKLICTHGDDRIRARINSGYLEDPSYDVKYVLNAFHSKLP